MAQPQKYTALIEVELEVSPYDDEDGLIPTGEQALAYYRRYCAGEILSGKELSENYGEIAASVSMEIKGTTLKGRPFEWMEGTFRTVDHSGFAEMLFVEDAPIAHVRQIASGDWYWEVHPGGRSDRRTFGTVKDLDLAKKLAETAVTYELARAAATEKSTI